MNAEIISIGSELLLGEITDTNSIYLKRQLPLLGIDLHWVTLVGDNRVRLSEAFHQAWKRSDIIIATGGLGPTEDDLTREAIAEALDEELKVSPNLEQELRGIFACMGWKMHSNNIKQATLIPSAQSIPNPRGTAPGWWIEKERKIIVAMPGPPWEMQHMWANEVMPRLKHKLQKEFILTRTIKTFGLSESEVDETVSPLFPSTNPELGVYAKFDGIHLRVIARDSELKKAEEMITQSESRLREILAENIWGFDNDTLEDVVGALLVKKSMTIATMESFKGNLLANTLSDALKSSNYYKGGYVAFSNDTKIALGVDAQLLKQYGAVSAEVAEAMAMAARQRLEANIGIGITGFAGSDRIEEKPSGLVHIAILDDRGKWVRNLDFLPQFQLKHRTTAAALFGLRQRLLSLI